MGKLFERTISLACVIIMVLTAFHVMVGDASGEETEEVGDTPAFVHRQTRITISDVAATDPAIACDEDGVLHLAWVDHSGETVRLAYKRSMIGQDFGQDRYLTPWFVSIDNIRVAAAEGQAAIVFDALLDSEEDRQVFLLLSSDSGLSWSQTNVVGRGHDPSVSISALGPVIGLSAYDGEGDSFVSMLLTAEGNQLVNSTGLFRLPFGDGVGEIVVEGDLTHFAFDFLVFVASGGLFLLMLHMAEMGLKKLGQMLSATATIVKNAVDEMAKALNNFLDWVIEMVQDILDSTIGPLINSVQSTFSSYLAGIFVATQQSDKDINSSGKMSLITQVQLSDAIFADLFWVLLTVACTLFIAIGIMSMGVGTLFDFVTSLIVSLAISMFLVSIMMAPAMYQNGLETIGASTLDVLKDAIFGQGGTTTEDIWSGVFDVLWGIFDIFCTAIITVYPGLEGVIENSFGLILGGLSVFLDIYGTAVNSTTLDVVGMLLGFFGMTESVKCLRSLQLAPLGGKIILIISVGVSGIGFGKNFLDVYERWN